MWIWLPILIWGLWLIAKGSDEALAARAIAAANSLPGAEQAVMIYSAYHPTSVGISACRIPHWRAEFHANPNRRIDSAGFIDVADLDLFNAASRPNFRASGLARLQQIEGPLNAFPIDRPVITNEPKPPVTPQFIKLDDVLAAGAVKRLSWRDQRRVRSIIAEKNRIVSSAYEGALSRRQASQDKGLDLLKDMVAEWERGKAAWEGARDREADGIRSLIALIEGVDDPEAATREVLRRIAWPAWMPSPFEVKFDRHAKTLIVEHEFPNLEEVNWINSARSQGQWGRNNADDDEAAAASKRLYPTLSFFLARTVVGQLPAGGVSSIAVNGWRHVVGKRADTPKRAYCASLIVTVSSLHEIERNFSDPTAAFDAAGGLASGSLTLKAIVPAIRINSGDIRFINWSEQSDSNISALAS